MFFTYCSVTIQSHHHYCQANWSQAASLCAALVLTGISSDIREDLYVHNKISHRFKMGGGNGSMRKRETQTQATHSVLVIVGQQVLQNAIGKRKNAYSSLNNLMDRYNTTLEQYWQLLPEKGRWRW